MTTAILFIGGVLFLGQVFSSLFEKTRLPDVLPLMLLGLLIGPVSGWVHPADFGRAGEVFTTLALIVVLFHSGVNFKLLSLRGAMGQGALLATAAFAVICSCVAGLAHGVMGLPWLVALVMGAILADNSTAIIIPLLDKLHMTPKAKTVLFVETNIVGVYSIVFALAFLGAAAKGDSLSARGLALTVLQSGGIGVGLSVIAGMFWMCVLHRVRGLENAISLTFAFVLLVYGLSELAGGDGAIATLVFGILAGNIRLMKRLWLKKLHLPALAFNRAEKSFFEEIEFIFKTLFFVYMGICLRVGSAWPVLGGLALVGVKLLLRAPCVNFCLSAGVSRRDCALLWATCPNGLVSAVLAAMAAQQLPQGGAALQDVVSAVIFFSVIVTGLMSLRIEKGGLLWAERFFSRHTGTEPAGQPGAQN